MFEKLIEAVKSYISGPSLRETFEDMVVQQTVQEQLKVSEPVNPQITDAVTQVGPEKPKRKAAARKPRTKKK